MAPHHSVHFSFFAKSRAISLFALSWQEMTNNIYSHYLLLLLVNHGKFQHWRTSELWWEVQLYFVTHIETSFQPGREHTRKKHLPTQLRGATHKYSLLKNKLKKKTLTICSYLLWSISFPINKILRTTLLYSIATYSDRYSTSWLYTCAWVKNETIWATNVATRFEKKFIQESEQSSSVFIFLLYRSELFCCHAQTWSISWTKIIFYCRWVLGVKGILHKCTKFSDNMKSSVQWHLMV